jgi:hypothetical protein
MTSLRKRKMRRHSSKCDECAMKDERKMEKAKEKTKVRKLR